MIRLSPHACRILGVLVEKAHTTPAQYPLSLNALVTGANQKSNREPVLQLSEDQVLTTIDELRSAELLREVMLSGSRVTKYRHVAHETLAMSTSELVVIVELMLRGPQTVGEIRGRASRMHAIESIEATDAILDNLMQREEPMIERIAPAPGSRAARFAQLLCPNLHPVSAAAAPLPSAAPSVASAAPDLEARIQRLESRLTAIEGVLRHLGASFDSEPGAADESDSM